MTNDVERLFHIGKQCDFSGRLGSLDFIHWRWKNCPIAWVGRFAGCSGSLTIILEAIVDHDPWI